MYATPAVIQNPPITMTTNSQGFEIPPEQRMAAWKFIQKKLYKVCPELHDECVEMNKKFVLACPNLDQCAGNTHYALRCCLQDWHRKLGIKLGFALWEEMILDCLDAK